MFYPELVSNEHQRRSFSADVSNEYIDTGRDVWFTINQKRALVTREVCWALGKSSKRFTPSRSTSCWALGAFICRSDSYMIILGTFDALSFSLSLSLSLFLCDAFSRKTFNVDERKCTFFNTHTVV